MLVHTSKNWVGTASTLIPIECLSVTKRTRFDGRILYRGLKVVALVLLSSLLLIVPNVLINDQALTHALGRMWPLLTAVVVLTVLYLAYTLMRSLHRSPTVRFEAVMSDGVARFECWEDSAELGALARLLERIVAQQHRLDDLIAFRLDSSYQFFQFRSFRIAFARAATITAFLVAPCLLLALWLYEPRIGFLLALPWLVYFGMFLWDRFGLAMQPPLLRAAVNAFELEKYELARERLQALEAEYPDYMPGLVLQAQACTLLGDTTTALRICDRVESVAPNTAHALQDEILCLDRIHRRMDNAD